MNDCKINQYYVYIHTRTDSNKVFYVGKGKGSRAWDNKNRNTHWNNIVRKHGYEVEICQDNLSESDSFLLEMWLIAKFRNEGLKLCNLTYGGEGQSGFAHPSRKVIYCSNGMKFDKLGDAVEWLRLNINKSAHAGALSSCAQGKSMSAHGFAWSYDGVPDHPEFTGYESTAQSTIKTHSKTVYCSNGMTFESATDAARWCVEAGSKNATVSGITSHISVKTSSIYGFAWSYDRTPYHPKITGREATSMSISESNKKRVKPVTCSNGMKFVSTVNAVKWLVTQGFPKAAAGNISACALGKVKTAYGFSWNYTN